MAPDVTSHLSCLTLTSADDARFPVVAGDAEFTCETDGSVYSWILKERGLRRKHRAPLCGIKV
jgi:hypothetical protein